MKNCGAMFSSQPFLQCCVFPRPYYYDSQYQNAFPFCRRSTFSLLYPRNLPGEVASGAVIQISYYSKLPKHHLGTYFKMTMTTSGYRNDTRHYDLYLVICIAIMFTLLCYSKYASMKYHLVPRVTQPVIYDLHFRF